MNQFVVSARKYRPATFDTVVGQSHITNTLKNAIRNNHVAQAFLFCGPRGVGKTTCARILAKTLNCRNLTDQTEACNACESCVSFNQGQSLNIYELDAASNNSVDDIRGLVEQVRYAPHSGEYKIYIIDEVHMLSTSAFNAFLKTLEEPPSYAVFILATTEKHKIIPTILSRCQIFDFNRIQVDDIAHHLKYVAEKEAINAEDDALHIIAQKADGALRDALSIFDQIVSFAGTTVTYKDVLSNLNILDYDYYFRITDDIVTGDVASLLLTFNELLSDGFDGHHFINGLAGHFRDLLVSQDPSTVSLLEVSQGTREHYLEQAKDVTPALLFALLEITGKCDLDYRIARNQRLHVELALLKMSSLSGNTTFTTSAEKKNPELKAVPASAPAVKPAASPSRKETSASPAVIPTDTGKIVPAGIPSLKATEVTSATKAIQPESKPAIKTGKPATGFLKGASLQAALKDKEVAPAAPAAPDEDQPRTPFTIEYLHKHWIAYAELQLKNGKRQLHATLTMNLPAVVNADEIELPIHNQSQENLLQEEKQGLMDYLRKNLVNYYILFRTIISDNGGNPEQAYTIKEKYQKMVEKNPDLEEFRKQLGLELDT